ncbi:hypothetical protein AUK14_01410 [Candidatus Berkelbacteria bacterium CG2_30_39_44]|uniref:t-SNARE coiled-coil homology domain-containing protein n=2 Tax=Candidatus Berkelbacteria TaxID=1618330 RepID=A0A2M7CHH4_9BACT|nr:MAG: hypothetical protein AUK14_01410 [Candidatus Berkelbacteria bacterium CG2_30_39_44]PIV25092.1 MAG: hypothetical protein COS38_03445 [Candidatus Berkelbacteria bacterium CG03_land_8_20_14_0_80_40_36]
MILFYIENMANEKKLEKLISEKFALAIKHTDKRFDELAYIVSDGFSMMGARFEKRFEQIDQRFEQIDQRFEQIDQRFEQIESRLRHIEARLDMLETDVAFLRSMRKDLELTNQLLDQMVTKKDLEKIEKRVKRLERKVGIA